MAISIFSQRLDILTLVIVVVVLLLLSVMRSLLFPKTRHHFALSAKRTAALKELQDQHKRGDITWEEYQAGTDQIYLKK